MSPEAKDSEERVKLLGMRQLFKRKGVEEMEVKVEVKRQEPVKLLGD